VKALYILIKQLLNANPFGVQQLLFEHTGYSGPLDADAVFSAYVLCGDPFLKDLYSLFDDYDYADPQSGTNYKKFTDFWNQAKDVIIGVGGVAAAITAPKTDKPDPEEAKQKKIWKAFMWSAIGLTVVLLIIALIVKRK
jgi:hypothetical protein